MACRALGWRFHLGARATMVADPDAVTRGVAMDLTDRDLELLYSADGLRDYRPARIECDRGDGDRFDAIAYVVPEDLAGARDPEYEAALSALRRRLGLEPHPAPDAPR